MLEIGFLDHLLEPSQLTARTDEFAQHIAGLAPLAVRAMKTILQQAASGNIDQRQAEQLSRRASESQDLQEGFAAKSEKRVPQFRGE
jgi:enoyl-CoA hydratase/carnithine racemase